MALAISPSINSYSAVLLLIFALSVLYFLIKLYRVRSFVAKLQRQGLVGEENISFLLCRELVLAPNMS